MDYQHREFEYRRPASVRDTPYPVVIVGAGPVGLSAAIDLAQQGVPVLVLDDDNRLSAGSRAICFAKRTLEIFDRLGCGERMVEKGVSWNVGKVFFRDKPVYTFNLLPETGHRRPAFINLQQYYVEGFLHEQAERQHKLEIRWKSKVTGVTQGSDCVDLTVETPDGPTTVRAAYVVAADGSRSSVRQAMGLETKGRVFRDRFLIADVRVNADFPTERWFWFDPPFHPNQSVLLHRQPDNILRIDFQLGWDADPVAERAPERVIPRVRALLGNDVEFELEWVSVYTFSCLRIEKFRHGRVLFAGDAAHGVSPFGARGANSGVQDADNLAWKLKSVLNGEAPDTLLDTYAAEREFAADENILNSTRSTDFITPKSAVSKVFRDAVLELSKDFAFARKIVNSGRLSLPSAYRDSALNTPDTDTFNCAMAPGAPACDAPVRIDGHAAWFIAQTGNDFCGLYFAGAEVAQSDLEALQSLSEGGKKLRLMVIVPSGSNARSGGFAGLTVIEDLEGLLVRRFDASAGTFYLLRPDQHVCARWRRLDPASVRQAQSRAVGRLTEEEVA